MTRFIPLLVVLVVVVGTFGMIPGVGGAESTSIVAPGKKTDQPSISNGTRSTDTGINGSDRDNRSVAPGARFVGVVGVQQAEIDGELETREFDIKVTKARTNDSKAAVVAAQLTTIEDRLENLKDQKETLDRGRETGSLPEDTYRARVATLTARIETAERLATASEGRARELPRETLERNDINVTAIQTLKRNAEDMTGPEVVAITRSIAGPRVGASIGRDESPGTGSQTGGSVRGNDRDNTSSDGPPADVPNDDGGADNESDSGLPPATSDSDGNDRGNVSNRSTGSDGADRNRAR